MGNIRCLICRNEITTISGMACPHCGAKLSHVLISFLTYLGPDDSLNGYQRSYKLVFLNSVFDEIKVSRKASVAAVAERFREYYLERKRYGLITDRDADNRITEIEKSDLRDIWLLIEMNPYAAISKKGFIKVKGDGLNGFFVLQKGLDSLSAQEINSVQDLLNKKLERYYKKINPTAVSFQMKSSAKSEKKATEVIHEDGKTVYFTDWTPVKYASNPIEQPAVSTRTVSKREKHISVSEQTGDIPLEQTLLSARTCSKLKRNGVETLHQLKTEFEKGTIAEFKGISNLVIQEISAFLSGPAEKEKPSAASKPNIDLPSAPESKKEEAISAAKQDTKDVLFEGGFSGNISPEIQNTLIHDLFPESVFNMMRRYCDRRGLRIAKDLIGISYMDLFNEKGFGKGKVAKIIDRWNEIEQGRYSSQSTQDVLGGLIIEREEAANVPAESDRSEDPRRIVVHATNSNFRISVLNLLSGKRKIISQLSDHNICTIGDLNGISVSVLENRIQMSIDPLLPIIELFSKPYSEVVDGLFGELEQDKNFEIFMTRISGKTLQACADEYNVTRERVRQVCVKIENKIYPIILPLVESLMDQNNARYFREEQIRECVENDMYANAAVHTLREHDTYISFGAPSVFLEEESYPKAEQELAALCEDLVGDGINVFESEAVIDSAFEEAGYGFLKSDDFLDLLIKYEYVFYGDFAVKSAKSYALLCAQVVADEFPEGITNDDEDMARLRSLAKERYGDLDIPENNRSLFARVTAHLVLRGRSRYISPKHVFADESVMSEIKAYIDNSERQDLFYGEIFAEFEGLLMMMTNIDNHWFLHGVLVHYYPNDYTYSRDYLSKNSGSRTLDLGERITRCLKNAGNAMSKKDLLRNFPGISEVMILNAIANTAGLIQWEYNCYNCIENVPISTEELSKLENIISQIADANDGYCSEGMLFREISKVFPSFLQKFGGLNSQNVFYICTELLEKTFDFRRPHIARSGRFSTLNVIDIAKDMLGTSDRIKASHYFKITKQLLWPHVTAGMAFADLEQDYIRLNADEYVIKSKFHISEEDLNYARSLLEEASGGAWYLPLQMFAESEDELPSGYALNEFFVGALANEFDLGWHVVSPQMKDRRYQRGILVRNDVSVQAYDELICIVLSEQSITSISQEDLQGFLQIHSLILGYIPKELEKSSRLKFNNGMFEVL